MQSQTEERAATSQSFEVNFVADVHLVQILGEQLIGSEKVGILELIKNSYDAGASTCDVWIEKVPGLPRAPLAHPEIAELRGPVITIIDDGCGMDQETIENGWLRPATRIKTSIKQRLKREKKKAEKNGTLAEYRALVAELKRGRGGRLPLGEKGVGRFATHRLGTNLILLTKTAREPYEWSLHIDWDRFDAPDDAPLDLDKVKLKLERHRPGRDYGSTHSGTMLRIFGGRDGFPWTEDTVRQIGYAIAHLRSPAKGKWPGGFDVRFHCPQLSETIEIPTKTVPAPFECTALVDEEGKADIEFRFDPPASLSKPIPPHQWNTDSSVDLRYHVPRDEKNSWISSDDDTRLRAPLCGPFSVEIKLWLRRNEWIDAPDWLEFRDYLDAFGGIGMYRDGLGIIASQKTSQDDWLGLAARHIKKGQHISYYQMSGSVDLAQESSLDVIDRTSREGLLETQPFHDLRRLVRAIVFRFETFVQDTRRRYELLEFGTPVPRATATRQARLAAKVLSELVSNYDFEGDMLDLDVALGAPARAAEVLATIAETVSRIPQVIRDLEKQSDALLEAAGYGISVGVAIHEIEKITSNLYFGLENLSSRRADLSDDVYARTVVLSQRSKALLNELKRIAPLRITRLEPKTIFGVRDCVLAAKGAFRLHWEEIAIEFQLLSDSEDFDLEGSFGACSQVFANLYDNATYWLTTSAASDRKIVVQVDNARRRVVVADSGPGIDEQIRPHLFKPFYSLKSPPSGLGLYICRYYLRQMKGSIRETFPSNRIPGIPGAQFTISFRGEG